MKYKNGGAAGKAAHQNNVARTQGGMAQVKAGIAKTGGGSPRNPSMRNTYTEMPHSLKSAGNVKGNC